MNKCRRIGTLITKFLRKEIGCVTMKRQTITRTSSDAQPGKKRHWREGLLETMEEPESIVRKDDKIVVVKDKYPKARHHFLILPREPINSLKDITEQHKQLLEHMEKIASEVADEQKGYEFLIGYHAVPTMSRLHLHVISTDFDSPCLKTKHHWNSFTTPFLRHPKDVREELDKYGHIKWMSSKESDELLKKDLQCHKCSEKPKNMPQLKKHLLSHLSK